MIVSKRVWVRSILGAAAATALLGGAWAQGQPVKIGLLATLEGPFAAGGADGCGRSDLLTTQEREEIRRLRRENYELRRANEILKSANVFIAKELDPDRSRRAASSTSIVAASGSSRSAEPWACRRPLTTSGGAAVARRGRLRTSGC